MIFLTTTSGDRDMMVPRLILMVVAVGSPVLVATSLPALAKRVLVLYHQALTL
jgi:hypothetical protein